MIVELSPDDGDDLEVDVDDDKFVNEAVCVDNNADANAFFDLVLDKDAAVVFD